MYSNLKETITEISKIEVSQERKEILQPLVDYIAQKTNENAPVLLNFICTHNSRRSHLAQIWAQTMALHFQIPNVFCYSGGTEATAMFPKVAETLLNQGFESRNIGTKLSKTENPVYAIKYADNSHPIICFSKKYDDAFNPVSKFAAIMTCSSADQGCPFIAGAEKRIPIQYEDPKAFDGTNLMNEKYAERSLEIASEMHYIFSQIKK